MSNRLWVLSKRACTHRERPDYTAFEFIPVVQKVDHSGTSMMEDVVRDYNKYISSRQPTYCWWNQQGRWRRVLSLFSIYLKRILPGTTGRYLVDVKPLNAFGISQGCDRRLRLESPQLPHRCHQLSKMQPPFRPQQKERRGTSHKYPRIFTRFQHDNSKKWISFHSGIQWG